MSFRIVLLASAAAIASSANAQVSTSTGDTDSPPEANASREPPARDLRNIYPRRFGNPTAWSETLSGLQMVGLRSVAAV